MQLENVAKLPVLYCCLVNTNEEGFHLSPNYYGFFFIIVVCDEGKSCTFKINYFNLLFMFFKYFIIMECRMHFY